jgi:hypothetical protein
LFGAGAFGPLGGDRGAAELDSVRAELAQLAEHSRSQFDAAAEECLPLGIALGVAALRGRFLREPIGLGNKVPKDYRDQARWLFDRIAATWAPGYDDEVLVERLSDPAEVRALAALAVEEPLREDDVLGYAPVDLDVLLRISARALAPRLDALAHAVHKEDAEWRAAAEAVRLARKQAGIFSGRMRQVELSESEAAERKERFEAMDAVETMFDAIDTAADAFPPFKLRSSLRPLLAEPKLPETTRETLVDPNTGYLTTIPTLFSRALVGRALARVVSATEEVFPGLLALASGEPSDSDLADLARRGGRGAASPFREAHDASGREDDASVASSEDALFDAMDRAGVFRLLDQAVAHCAVLGRLRVVEANARARVKVVDKINVFTQSREQEVAASLAARREWHSETLRTIAWSIADHVHHNGAGFPPLDLYRHVRSIYEMTYALVPTLVTSDAQAWTGGVPVAAVHGIVPFTTFLRGLGATVGRIAGLGGTKLDLARRVAAVIEAGEPTIPFPADGRRLHPDQVARCAAHTLVAARGREFPKLVAHYATLMRSSQESADRAETAASEVGWFDKINVFTDSAAEKARDGETHHARLLLSQAQAAFTTIYRELDIALAPYPAGLVYFGLSDVAVRAEMIHAVAERIYGSRNQQYRAVLVGRDPFLTSFAGWTTVATRVFGGLVSPGQVLERYALRQLWAPPQR